jgi:N-acetyl-anhydromuramyl-L-alanine amidase AmpD
LEREKAQNEIIIKVIETGDTESAKKNLLFLIAAGLVKDPDRKIAEAATNPETSPVLPSVALPTLDLGYRVPKLPRKISEVIISDTQTPNFASTLAGLSNVKVSYHYLIEESGTTHRLVDEALVAFHTSGHNDNSIGIGLIHSRGQPYPEAQIDALNILLADVVKRNAISLDKILPKSAVDSRKTTDVAPKIDEIRKIIEAKNDGVTGRGDR